MKSEEVGDAVIFRLEKYQDAIKTVLEYLQKSEISLRTKSKLYRVLGE